MKPIDELQSANPAQVQEDWGSSVAGQAVLASVVDRIDEDAELQPLPAKTPKPWVYAATGLAVVLLAAVPAFLLDGPDGRDPVVGDVFRSADSPDMILADNVVTDRELGMAAQATVECIREATGSQDTYWEWQGEGDESVIAITTDASEGTFNVCEAEHLRLANQVWARQRDPEPAEGFYFYAAAVRCTEARSGQQFGQLTQDSLGFASTESLRTINRALSEQREVYDGCLDDVSSQPLHYYFVLECVSETSGVEYEGFVDPGTGRLTPNQIQTLDAVRAEYGLLFDSCMHAVASD
jgi:hypothetical protein